MRSMNGPRSQQGVMLIEALIGILIFSIGILALIGMQGVAIKNTADSRYRSEAAFLANQVVGQMWADIPNLTKYDTTVMASCAVTPPNACTRRDDWRTQVERSLPGIDVAAGTLAPAITVDSSNPGNIGVKVLIQWKQPGETQSRRLEFNNRINPGI